MCLLVEINRLVVARRNGCASTGHCVASRRQCAWCRRRSPGDWHRQLARRDSPVASGDAKRVYFTNKSGTKVEYNMPDLAMLPQERPYVSPWASRPFRAAQYQTGSIRSGCMFTFLDRASISMSASSVAVSHRGMNETHGSAMHVNTGAIGKHCRKLSAVVRGVPAEVLYYFMYGAISG